MGTLGTRKNPKIFQGCVSQPFPKGQAAFVHRQPWLIRCPWPSWMMGDGGADLAAVASLLPADAATDPAPRSPCGSRELRGSRCFLLPLCFKVVLGACKVSMNLPRGLFGGGRGSQAGVSMQLCCSWGQLFLRSHHQLQGDRDANVHLALGRAAIAPGAVSSSWGVFEVFLGIPKL